MSNLSRCYRRALAALALACLVAVPAAAKTKLTSAWPEREISIDGEPTEWRDALVYVSSVDTFVGVLNDERWLYVCLYSRSPEVARELAEDGLRLRLESKRGGRRTVRFPPGATPAAIELWLPDQRDPITVAPDGGAGVEAGVSYRGSFVLETKLPLTAEGGLPWSVGVAAGDTVRVTIENPEIDEAAEDALESRARRPRAAVPGAPGGSDSLYGDPGWNGGVGAEEPFLPGRFVFLLKARIDLVDSR